MRMTNNKKDEEEEKRTFTVPLYEYQAQTPDLGGQSLSDVYGSASMPMFRWVKKVQTGEKVIDLEDTGDQEMHLEDSTASSATCGARARDATTPRGVGDDTGAHG